MRELTKEPARRSWTSFVWKPLFPDTESYIWQLRSNFIRNTDLDCDLPDSGLERQAGAMIAQLAKVGALEVLADD